MRKHSDWLTQADERILEFLSERGNHPPKAILDAFKRETESVQYGQDYIGSRCRVLADHGLVVNVGGGTYSITELGEQYLAGDLDAAALDSGDDATEQ